MNILRTIGRKYQTIVHKMCLAAILAGSKIMDVYSKDDFGVEIKGDDSPITFADRLSDIVISKTLKLNFPNIPIISEESYYDLNSVMPKIYFLVDPLDGTKEFIKKTGEFTVNIAVIVNSRAELGVVYVPATGDVYYRALDGCSYLEQDAYDATMRGERIKICCKTVEMDHLSVVKSLSHSTPETENYISNYAVINSVSAGSSLKFGLIASGVADLYPRLGRTMEWDTGAAHAVLKGAGGNVRRLDTLGELFYGKPGMANPYFVASGNDMTLIPHNG